MLSNRRVRARADFRLSQAIVRPGDAAKELVRFDCRKTTGTVARLSAVSTPAINERTVANSTKARFREIVACTCFIAQIAPATTPCQSVSAVEYAIAHKRPGPRVIARRESVQWERQEREKKLVEEQTCDSCRCSAFRWLHVRRHQGRPRCGGEPAQGRNDLRSGRPYARHSQPTGCQR